MELLYINIIRGVVTNFFVLLHLFSLDEAKYGKRTMRIAFVAVYLMVTAVTTAMYFTIDMTQFTKLSAFVWIVTGLACKPLFQGGFMKWLFNIITVLNVFIFVVFKFNNTVNSQLISLLACVRPVCRMIH